MMVNVEHAFRAGAMRFVPQGAWCAWNHAGVIPRHGKRGRAFRRIMRRWRRLTGVR